MVEPPHRRKLPCTAKAIWPVPWKRGAFPAAANALRNYVAERRSAPSVDEEHFKLLTGFNDIFVAIAAALILVAAARIGAYFG